MSRIGKQAITVPSGIDITINSQQVAIKGPKGKLEHIVPACLKVFCEEGRLLVKLTDRAIENGSALHGLTRAILQNMITGVLKGFEKRLEILGVGYRAQGSGKKMTFSLGFSHPIDFNAPEGISLEMDKEKKNVIIVSGIDKQMVGEVAANIRAFRPPEPYKGKGIRYEDEYVFRKAGKKATKE